MSKHSKSNFRFNGKALISMIVAVVILISTVLCVPTLFSFAEEDKIPYIEVKSGAAWSTARYYNDKSDGGYRLVAGAYYKLVFDYKAISGKPSFEFDGMRASDKDYKSISDLTASYDASDVITNGISQKVIKFRVKTGSTSNIDKFRIVIGAYAEATNISCAFANPTLYRYTNDSYSVLHSTQNYNHIADISDSTVYDVMANDPIHESNKNSKWNLRYLTGKQSTVVHSSLTVSEYKEKFAPPEYMINFYKGGQNNVAVYEDATFSSSNSLTFTCDYKLFSGSPSFSVQTDNGSEWVDVSANTEFNTENCTAKLEFNGTDLMNGLRIIVGNNTSDTDVSFSIANAKLCEDGSIENLLNSIHSSTVVYKPEGEDNENGIWNIRTDADNKVAVDCIIVPENYFTAKLEDLMYTTKKDTNSVRTEYRDSSFSIDASKTYVFTTKFKVTEGEFTTDSIGDSTDPIATIFLNGDFYSSSKVKLNKSCSNLDYYDALYDEDNCELTIKFSTTKNYNGLYIYLGSMSDNLNSVISFAYPEFVEVLGKNSSSDIISNNQITDLNKNSYVHMGDKKDKFWNMRTAGTANDYTLTTASLSSFTPVQKMLSFLQGCQNATLEYEKIGNLVAGDYTFTAKFKSIIGSPTFEVYSSTDSGANYSLVNLTTNAMSGAYAKKVTFTLPSGINALKIVIGNKTSNANVAFSISNPILVKTGETESLLKKLSSTNIVYKDKTDNNAPNKWNVKWDKSLGVDEVVFKTAPDDYFQTQSESLKYQNALGAGYSNAEYRDTTFVASKDKTYKFTAKLKVLAGSIDEKTIGVSSDPITSIFLNGDYYSGSSKIPVKLGSDKFENVNIVYDEADGDLVITFKPKENYTGLYINFGSISESAKGVISVGEPCLIEVSQKSNGVYVYSENLIKDITEDTIKKIGTRDNFVWNIRFAGTQNDYSTSEIIEDNEFDPSNSYIKINKGAKNSYITYMDSSTTFKPGYKYQFSINYRVYSGSPVFEFSLKNGGKSFEVLSEKSSFLNSYTEEYDDVNMLKTITFEVKSNISGFKLVTGNTGTAKNVSIAIANPTLHTIDSNGVKNGVELITPLNKIYTSVNSTSNRTWDITCKSDDDYEYDIPIPSDMFSAPSIIKVKSNVSWNHVEYVDKTLYFEAGKTYRFGVDYMASSGSPTFKIYNENSSSKYSISSISSYYKDSFDPDTSIRSIEFTLEKDQQGAFIILGNYSDSKSISCSFANPTLYEIDSNGKTVGTNMIVNMTNDSCYNVMANDPTSKSNKSRVWNLRYSGVYSQCLAVEKLEDGYFRKPAIAVSNSNGNLTQYVTVKPNTTYAFIYKCKNYGPEATPFINYYTNTSNGSISKFSYTAKNYDGCYNRRYEFKTPANLRASDNLRIGIQFTSSVNSSFADFELYELSTGFDTIGSNLLHNPSFGLDEEITTFDNKPTNKWVFEGTTNGVEVTERATACFTVPVAQMLTFMGKTDYDTSSGEVYSSASSIGKVATLTPGKTYNFSLNLKYANIGNEGETGLKLYSFDGVSWKEIVTEISESKTEYKFSAKFVMPNAYTYENFKFEVKVGSGYVSGYLANAIVVEDGKTNNLFENGELYYGVIGWETSGSFNKILTSDIPQNYFSKTTTNTPSMIVYRNTASWVRFNQTLTLKPNTYYKLVANGVHPWQQNDELVSEIAVQTFTATYEDGKRTSKSDKFMSGVKDNPNLVSGKVGNVVTKYYKTPSDLIADENISVYLYMEGVESAGYWGDMALYEIDEKGNYLSGNIMLNSDFSLGETAWTHTGDFTYRIVEQPANFFKTYTKNDKTMVVSNGTEKNAELGQWINVKRGTKYYFSCFYIGMNGAGITPKIMYTNQAGQYVSANLKTSMYDSSRFFYEAEFELPEDISSVRGSAKAKFVINNNDGGKGYITNVLVCEDGKYNNLLKNPKFADGFAGWVGNDSVDPYHGTNYKITAYDDSVYTFYYDDSLFDDGDWSGTGKKKSDDEGYEETVAEITIGKITGLVVNGNDEPIKDLTIVLDDNAKTVTTDEEGKFDFFDLQPGEYKISIVGPNGSLIVAKENVPVQAGKITNISKIVYKTIGDSIKLGDKNLKNKYYGVVCGYLFDGDGNPLKGQEIFLGDIASVKTKAKGVFQFDDVPAGKYDIYTKLSDGSICILKRVEVSAGKGSIYKIKLPSTETNTLALILIISGCAVLLLGGAAAAFIFIKKGKNK